MVAEGKGEVMVEFRRGRADRREAAGCRASRRSKVAVLCMSDVVCTVNSLIGRQGLMVARTSIDVCGSSLVSASAKDHSEAGLRVVRVVRVLRTRGS